jgi:hypothetical protein
MSVDPRQIDFRDAFYTYAPGVLLTRDIETALGAQYAANGNTPLTQGQVLAIVGPLPAYPTGMKRFADSNPDPHDGWAIDNQGISP